MNAVRPLIKASSTRLAALLGPLIGWFGAAGQIPASPGEFIKPEVLVQQQVDDWNRHSVDEFVAPYSDSTSLYLFPNKLVRQFQTKAALKDYYAEFFAKNPNMHCSVEGRIVLDNTVILHERITGRADGRRIDSIVIYKIENGKIARVYFDYKR